MSEQKQKLKRPAVVIDPKGEPVEAKVWVNVFFFNDGLSYLGKQDHTSEESAYKVFLECEVWFDRNPDYFVVFRCGTHRFVKDFSYCIQMPKL